MPSTINVTTTDLGRTFAIIVSSAKMPSRCWGRYSNVALVELRSADARPAAIVESATGPVKRILGYSGKLHSGRTKHSADGRAIESYRAEIAALCEQDARRARSLRSAATRRARAEAACQLHAEALSDALGLAS